MHLIIGTRGSELALWQAHFVQNELKKIDISSELKIINTKGDTIQHLSFDKIEGKGFFTKEIEDALLSGEVDLAVHSMKDLPTSQPEGLKLAAVSYRDDASDWLIINKESVDNQQVLKFKLHAKIGTSSARRKSQLQDFRPDAHLLDIRGNVPTRIQKLAKGDFDAIMLAAAGLNRLNLDLSAFHVVKLNPREFVPAPAQGVLALQVRAQDLQLQRAILPLHHAEVANCTNVERKILQTSGGGCHAPLGAYCECDNMGNYHLFVANAKQLGEPLQRIRLSSATKLNLAEQALSLLKF